MGFCKRAPPTLFIGPPDADTASVVREQALGATLVPGAAPEVVAEVLKPLAASERRRCALPAPPDGPERIAGFVCRGPVRPNHVAP